MCIYQFILTTPLLDFSIRYFPKHSQFYCPFLFFPKWIFIREKWLLLSSQFDKSIVSFLVSKRTRKIRNHNRHEKTTDIFTKYNFSPNLYTLFYKFYKYKAKTYSEKSNYAQYSIQEITFFLAFHIFDDKVARLI